MKLKPDVTVAETDYGMVLLDGRTGEYWTLNPSGAIVAKELLSGGGLAGAVNRLTEEFSVDHDEANEDALALIKEFKEAGLIEG